MSSKSEKVTITKSATCLCGGVSITATGTDKGAVACHCSNCQKASGSAFAHNYRMFNAELQVNKGQDLIKKYDDNDTKSGNSLYRHFCTNCGTPLYLTNSAFKGLVVMHAGTMQDRTQPRLEFFAENRNDWISELKASQAKM